MGCTNSASTSATSSADMEDFPQFRSPKIVTLHPAKSSAAHEVEFTPLGVIRKLPPDMACDSLARRKGRPVFYVSHEIAVREQCLGDLRVLPPSMEDTEEHRLRLARYLGWVEKNPVEFEERISAWRLEQRIHL
mmetsp:Transcript_73943/g.175978  ORF Transcript_73943/g.175978 Transcript_73943/m.175978 type:complete len:134 (+) Transcript_73943:101-502(+)